MLILELILVATVAVDIGCYRAQTRLLKQIQRLNFTRHVECLAESLIFLGICFLCSLMTMISLAMNNDFHALGFMILTAMGDAVFWHRLWQVRQELTRKEGFK